MTNESSARLRPKRWSMSRELHQPECRIKAKRLQYNANQPTSSGANDLRISYYVLPYKMEAEEVDTTDRPVAPSFEETNPVHRVMEHVLQPVASASDYGPGLALQRSRMCPFLRTVPTRYLVEGGECVPWR
ncbi:unnamed protein product [Protopolystoma xenopodis]|uniref:Uncharacterized protein n=1 Tax=Protopolystoma xenopodis TaxID=117903 RepID=A0A3S5FFN7_9PLAT|nr:unnamed protein product [Protopolystoma xenopodis]